MAQIRHLTKGQRDFLTAVRNGEHKSFHKRVIEAVEAMDLVQYVGGQAFRLVGRNSYPASDFAEV